MSIHPDAEERPGICGRCGSRKLQYSAYELCEGSQIKQDFHCETCGAKGTEYSDIVFMGTEMEE